MAKSQSELDIAFQQMEEDFAFTKEARRELIAKLRAEANKLTFSQEDKAMVIQAKVSILKTLDDVLKSDSDLALQKLKAKLARKDSETNGVVGSTIVAMLKSMRVNEEGLTTGDKTTDPTKDAMAAVTDRVNDLLRDGDSKTKQALDISEGETQECTDKPSSEIPIKDLKPLKEKDEDEV